MSRPPAPPLDGGLVPVPAPALARAPRAAASGAVWLALGIVYVAWGSTYLGIRVMDRTIPPLLGAGVRYVSAGVVMVVVLRAWRGRLPRLARRELAPLAVVSVLLLTAGNGGVTYAERHVPSGLAALLVASMPLWILVIRTLAGDRPQRATLSGLAIGFVGVGLLVLRGGHEQGVSVSRMLFVVGAALCWALGSWLAGRLPMPSDVTAGTAIGMLIGGVVLVGLSALSGERWHALTTHASSDSLVALGYLALFGSILAFTAYVWLLQHAPISQISTYAYVNPVVAVGLGALVLGERITAITLLGGMVIVVAVAVVIRAEARSTPAPAQRGRPSS